MGDVNAFCNKAWPTEHLTHMTDRLFSASREEEEEEEEEAVFGVFLSPDSMTHGQSSLTWKKNYNLPPIEKTSWNPLSIFLS